MKKALLALTFLLGCSPQYQTAIPLGGKTKLTQCIAENTTFYTAWYCESCKELKKELQENFFIQSLNIIDCYQGVEENPLCKDIYTFPTIKFQNGTILAGNYVKGYLTLEKFADLSGCD